MTLIYLSLSSFLLGCSEKENTDTENDEITDTADDADTADTADTEDPEDTSTTEDTGEETPVDADEDGYTVEDGDCDDEDPSIYPGAEDIPGDGIDQDCANGDEEDMGITLSDVNTGDIIITELMNNPTAVSDDDGEWIEIFNNSENRINLQGLEVSDDGDDFFTIDSMLILPAQEHMIFARNSDAAANGGVNSVYGYSNFILSNTSDSVILSHQGRMIDEVHYGSELGFGLSIGKSITLSGDHYDQIENDSGENWCPGPNPFGSLGDYGSPGEMNTVCPPITDNDGDGFDSTIDCNDNDEEINPTADEIWYDGVDQNCNGDSDYDQDRDGFDSADYSGTDCNDNDELINTEAYDIPGNGIDENCDNSDAENTSGVDTVATLAVGDLVISEIMYNPAAVADSEGEWFEILNSHPVSVDLGGLTICDNQGCMAIGSSLVVEEGQYVVLAKNGDSSLNGGVTADYAFGDGINGFGNNGDYIELSYNSVLLDIVDYSTGFPGANGASLNLSSDLLTHDANDSDASWCLSSTVFGSGDAGTPGAANEQCN
ncbi:MAG: lamin tail domain-containing protein [Myxococcota bacterium]|nr:lamin tail domain-containing protein [Myxococcota bacterium]